MSNIRVAFVCVRNAGRSQIATAFAEREVGNRGLSDRRAVVTGGTHPADAVHDVVVAAMDEVGIDLSDRVPRAVSTAELEACDYVATMGCSTLELGPALDRREWDLPDPGGEDLGTVREIRDTVRGRVAALFDDIEAELAAL